MKRGNNEFLRLLCNLYITALLVALPLYTGEGYGELGDTKYNLFRNISLLCLGCWFLAGMPGRIQNMVAYMGARTVRRGGDGTFSRRGQAAFGMLDCAMAAYAVCVLISTFCSSYRELAWNGYEGWFMGAVSQLLFVGIYFFVSRQYDGSGWPLYLGEAALFLVTVFGLLHRLGFDPLGLMEGWSTKSWVYSHMLSTLGNINWLCGYYSVALVFVTVHYLQEETLQFEILLYIVTVSAFILLGVQGSQGGLLILAVCVVCCVLLGAGQTVVLKRLCLLLTGFLFGMSLMGCLMEQRGDKAAVVADGNIFGSIKWNVWVIFAGICLMLFFLIKIKWSSGGKTLGRTKAFRGKISRPLMAVLLVTFLLASVMMAVLFLQSIDDSFGSGRGFLWRISIESFARADLKDKLLGAGPDCYAEVVFNRLGAGTDVWKGEHWDGAVFTNAHNEFLSQLCNIGILGTVSYSAIFLAGFWECWQDRKVFSGRFRKSWIGLTALAMYGAHSLISFQQVLNAPLLFLVLGLSEAQRRSPENEL